MACFRFANGRVPCGLAQPMIIKVESRRSSISMLVEMLGGGGDAEVIHLLPVGDNGYDHSAVADGRRRGGGIGIPVQEIV